MIGRDVVAVLVAVLVGVLPPVVVPPGRGSRMIGSPPVVEFGFGGLDVGGLVAVLVAVDVAVGNVLAPLPADAVPFGAVLVDPGFAVDVCDGPTGGAAAVAATAGVSVGAAVSVAVAPAAGSDVGSTTTG
jgi:hypothetical protein